jgi:ribonuclease P protein component
MAAILLIVAEPKAARNCQSNISFGPFRAIFISMVKFKNLFQFSQKEVSSFIGRSGFKAHIKGLRLMQVVADANQPAPNHGRLLIITPRTCGKAHLRNQLRRRLKAIFYTEQLYKVPEISIIIASRNAMLHSYDELKDFLVQNINSTLNTKSSMG